MDREDGVLSPDEAFGLLGNETRMAILEAVWESSAETVPFSDIRDRLGNPDSGQFNYHLDKLTGHFLASVEGGYELTQAGREVVRAVLAGTITERRETAPVGLDEACVDCGGPLVARYDEYGIVECGDCGRTVMWNEFPPAGLDGRTMAEAARAFDRWTQRRFRLAMDGVCPNCAASMERTVLGVDADDTDGIATMHRCGNCKYEARAPLFGHVVDEPAVVSFYHDRGVDLTEMPYWEVRSLARDFTERVVSAEPLEVEVTIPDDDDVLRVVLDEELAVTEHEILDDGSDSGG